MRSLLVVVVVLAAAGCLTEPVPYVAPDAAVVPEPEEPVCARELGGLRAGPQLRGVATALTLAAIDVDGHDDAIAILDGTSVVISMARADGSFEAPVEIATGTALAAIEARDLDLDGGTDLVVAGDQLLVLGEEDGALVERARTTLACHADAISLGDVDTDGTVDLVIACATSSKLLLARGQADTTFGAAVEIGTFPQVTGVNLAELIGGPPLDLVLSGGTVEILRGVGAGAFEVDQPHALAVGELAIADLDGDSDLDLAGFDLAADELVILRNQPGTFERIERALPLVFDVAAVHAVELGGAAGPELLLSGALGEVPFEPSLIAVSSVLDVPAMVQYPVASSREIAVGRFGGDAAVDVLAASSQGVASLIGGETAGFEAPATLVLPTGHEAVAAGQFDADPRLELVLIGDAVTIVEPSGDELVVQSSTPIRLDLYSPVAIDWTGDGVVDLIGTRYVDEDHLQLWLATATAPGNFGAPTLLEDRGGYAQVFDDFDDDGHLDVVILLPDDPMRVLFGGPGGVVDQVVVQSVDYVSWGVAADLVQGGPPELLAFGDGIRTLVLDDDRRFEVLLTLPSDDYVHGALIADVDGDGQDDVVAAMTDGARPRIRLGVYLGNGVGGLVAVEEEGGPTIISDTDRIELRSRNAAAVGDFDGDGIPDLLLPGLQVLTGRGDGTFRPPLMYPRRAYQVYAVPVEVGTLDQLVLVSYEPGQIELLAPGCD